MDDGIDEHAEVGFFVSNFVVQLLVDFVQGFGVDAFGEMGVFLGPILKYSFKIGTYSLGLFQELLVVFVEIELETVSDKHQIEYEGFVFRLIAGVAYNIAYKL